MNCGSCLRGPVVARARFASTGCGGTHADATVASPLAVFDIPRLQPRRARQDKPFDGVTVRVGTQASQWADAFKQYAPDFTKETGITLEFDDISFDVMYEKLTTGFIGGAFSYDMI
jgi:ABC-type glycerol-3-phosphate transport system substrate-binding protein